MKIKGKGCIVRVLELTKQIDLVISCRMAVVPCRDVARGPPLCRNASFGKIVFCDVPRVLYILHMFFIIYFICFHILGRLEVDRARLQSWPSGAQKCDTPSQRNNKITNSSARKAKNRLQNTRFQKHSRYGDEVPQILKY